MSNRMARRAWLAGMALGLAWLTGGAQAQDKLKVAAIYTVPVEQQWVSRIHQALTAAEQRGDITPSASRERRSFLALRKS